MKWNGSTIVKLLFIDFLAYVFRFVHTPELYIEKWYDRETETVRKSQLMTKINEQKKTQFVVLQFRTHCLPIAKLFSEDRKKLRKLVKKPPQRTFIFLMVTIYVSVQNQTNCT